MRLNLRGLRSCFISVFILMILSPVFSSPAYANSFVHANSLGNPSAATPWGVLYTGGYPYPGPCDGPYYSSPGAAVADVTFLLGAALRYSKTVYLNPNNPLAPTFVFDAPFTKMRKPPCQSIYSVAIGYAWSNFGQVCPDGSYHEKGAGSCPAYTPAPKLLGNPTDNTCHTGNCSVGDPIDAASGNVYEEIKDYESAGQNNLDFTRYYNSLATSTTHAVSLGSHWRTNYDRYLTVVSGTSVTVERPDGQGLSFTYNGTGWVTDSDIDMTLTHTGSGTGSTWVLKDKNDVSETYTQLSSGEGRLNSIKARDGYTQTLTYTGNQLTKVTDSFSRALNITYLSGGYINTVTTPSGLVLTYNYNSSGLHPGVNDRLAGVSYSTRPATSQSYSYASNSALPFLLTGITDENGALYGHWTYDAFGRGLTSQQGTGADLTSIVYVDGFMNVVGSSPTVTNALGQQTMYHFTPLQGTQKITEIDRIASATVPAMNEILAYDSNGYLASVTDWNGKTVNYVNDIHGQPTTISELGDAGTAARTTTITYDTTWIHLPKHIVAPNKTADFTYDGSGNMLTETDTDTSGGPTNGQTRTWTYTYDSFGHKLTEKSPRTDVTAITTYTYTGDNLSTVTDALGHISYITSYNGSGLPLSMTDPNGVVHTFTYDTRDRLLTVTANAASGNATTTLGYDGAENLTKITLPNNSSLTYTYDTAHRVSKVTDNLGDYITYTRDANGDATQTQTFNPSNVLSKTQTAAFDSIGRVLQQIGASGQTTTYTYDNNGNITNIQDALGDNESRQFDAYNRMLYSINQVGGYTQYQYDPQDNIVNVNDPAGLGTSYTYDGFGEVTSQVIPQSGTTSTTTYTLDKAGNRISETDGRGIVTNRTFDKLNRVLTETYPASTGENITYTYDAHSASNFGIGHLTGFIDESGSTTLTYNERGDLLTDSRVIGGKTYLTSYTYDTADKLLTMTYPSGHIIIYTRDAFGRIASVAYKPSAGGTSTMLASSITYKPLGPMASLTYGNGLTNTLTYDQDYRLTGIKTAGGSVNVQNLSLTYDNANDITSIKDNLDATRSQTFGYDKDYRLTSATGKYGTLGYTYDNNGNRESVTLNNVTSTYNYLTWGGNLPYTNQLGSISVGGKTVRTFTYTPDGNIATDSGDANFTYSNRNMVKQAVVGSTTATYKYNAIGQKVLKTVGSAVTSYQYDQAGNLLAESNGATGAVTREYVYLDNEPIAQIESNGTIYYIHTDQLGTPQKMTNSAKAIVWDRIQEPFGEQYSLTGTATNNLRFPGQFADGVSQTNQNGFRDYDFTLGRYTEADPIGLAGGTNLYAYVGGNPLRWSDRKGLDFGTMFPPGSLPPADQQFYYAPQPNPQMTPEELQNIVTLLNNLSAQSGLAATLSLVDPLTAPASIPLATISACSAIASQMLKPDSGQVLLNAATDIGVNQLDMDLFSEPFKFLLNESVQDAY